MLLMILKKLTQLIAKGFIGGSDLSYVSAAT